MLFTSLTFLFFFLGLMLVLVAIKNNTLRQYTLLFSSYIFYGAWNPNFIILIAASSIWGWFSGLLIHKAKEPSLKKKVVLFSVFLSIAPLAFFKYGNFIAENTALLFGYQWPPAGIILPVGISFFTFQVMSYTIDVYRRRIPVCTNLRKFMLFVAFFPQLVAGPIVRASEFLPQLDRKIKLKWRNYIIGGQIFLGGTIQKVLIADNLSKFVDPVFLEPELFSTGTLWLSLAAYSIQIFCDFSGYSLMAIGIARILGFELPENFHMPYLAKSITDFWRRWHMTLSFWLRDYLYISLGGNRKGNIRTYFNLLVTMLLGGLWHGASWNFVLWGGMHGLALAIHRIWEQKTHHFTMIKNTKPYKIFSWFFTMFIVGMLWVPFRCLDCKKTSSFYAKMFLSDGGIEWYHPYAITILIIVLFWHLLVLCSNKYLNSFPTLQVQEGFPSFVIGFSLLLIILFAPINTSPFIYFQF